MEDLHAPEPDFGGAQSPNEYLRQLMDHNGCYHLSSREWCTYEHVSLSATSGPQESISSRVTRHFNVLHQPTPSDEVLKAVYSTTIRTTSQMPSNICDEVLPSLLDVTLSVYHSIHQRRGPESPSTVQQHIVGLHSMSELISSIVWIQKKVSVQTSVELVELWVHEMQRIFRDGFATQADTAWYDGVVERAMASHISGTLIGEQPNQAVYTDMLDSDTFTRYDDMANLEAELTSKLQSSRPDYIVCRDVTLGLFRTYRLLTQGKNCLMLGEQFGRRDICKISAHLAGYEVQSTELSDWNRSSTFWRSHIKTWVRAAALDKKKLVVFASCSNGLDERFMLELCALTSGALPELFFTASEWQECMSQLRNADRLAPGENTEACFRRRVQENLRVVLGCPEVRAHCL